MHRGMLATRLVLPPSVWHPATDPLVGLLRQLAERFDAIGRPASLPDLPDTLPPVLTRSAWAHILTTAGLVLPDPPAEPSLADDAAENLLEMHLPRLLARGATLLATTATGLETPA
jgi:hypothetical protein